MEYCWDTDLRGQNYLKCKEYIQCLFFIYIKIVISEGKKENINITGVSNLLNYSVYSIYIHIYINYSDISFSVVTNLSFPGLTSFRRA